MQILLCFDNFMMLYYLLFTACEQLEKYYLQVHAYSGPDAMLVDILQKFIINSLRVTVSGKDYTASKTLYMTQESKVRKKKVDVLFTGLLPETKYKIVVQSLGDCSYSKKMKKATSKSYFPRPELILYNDV